MVKICDALRNLIVHKKSQGLSFRIIGTELNIGHSTVQQVWNKFLRTNSTADLPKSGRPCSSSERERRLICRISKKDPFLTAAEVSKSLGITNKVSVWTVRRYLRSGGLFGRMAARKPLLTAKHMTNRKKWCQAYSALSQEDWKKFIYSDECRFQTYSNVSRVVRRPRNSRFCHKYVVKTSKYAGASIMVWGAIKGDGTRILVRCPKRLNARAYQEVLESGLPQLYDPDCVFVQDNAPCHKSRTTLDYLDMKGVCLLTDWPAQSPDINIIENLWSILKAKVCRTQPKSEGDLWKAIQKEFNDIDPSVIINLYDSLPRRVAAVLKSKGAQTSY